MYLKQLIAHICGDYFFQNSWMTTRKQDSKAVCLIHSLVYCLPFLSLTLNPFALLIIGGTHFLIDHYSVARYFIKPKFEERTLTYSAVLLIFAVDNLLHLTINYLTLS